MTVKRSMFGAGAAMLALAASLASCDDHGRSPIPEAGGGDEGFGFFAELTRDRGDASFGSVVTGSTSPLVRITISNVGNAESGQVSTLISGADGGSFAIDANACAGKTLVIEGACTIDVVFSPMSVGPKTGTLITSASPGGTVAVKLDGDGVVSSR
jgi:hypothetical protein